MASTSSRDADSGNRSPASGAKSAGGGGAGGGRKGLGLLLALLGVLALAGLAIALFAGGDDEDQRSGQVERGTDGDQGGEAGSAAGTESGDLSGNGAGGAAAGAAAGAAGTLVASGTNLLPVPADGLAGSVGQSAQGTGVTVQSVVEDGFWVGTSQSDRAYVEWGGTVGEDESDTYLPKEGDRVDLTGPVRPAPEDPARTLKLEPADAELLTTQQAYVNADTVTPAQ